MKKLFEETRIVQDARNAQKGYFWLWEILLFFPMFLISSLAMLILSLPFELGLLFTDQGYLSAVQTGNIQLIAEASMRIASSDIYRAGSLVCEIMMIVATCLLCRWIQKRKLANMGFAKKGALKEYGIGMVVGFVIFTIPVLAALVCGSLKVDGVFTNFSLGMFLFFFVGFMFQGMAEEVLCRSYFMVSIARRYPVALAIFLNSFVFAALHLANAGIGVIPFINLTLFGVFASVYFIRRGSVWGIGAVHSIWNFVQGNFYGIKVSGMQMGCSVFQMSAVEGKEILNGGDFGLEGSIFVTIILVAGTLVLLFWDKARNVEATKIVEVVEEVAEETAEAAVEA